MSAAVVASGRVTYEEEIRQDAPIAWYRMVEESGPTLVDSSGNNHHGTWPVVPTFNQPGILGATGKGALFDGLAYGQVTATFLDGPDELTYETWLATTDPPDPLGTAANMVLGGRAVVGTQFYIDLQTNSKVRGSVTMTPVLASPTLLSTPVFEQRDGQWHHYAVTVYQNRLSLYFDAVELQWVDGTGSVATKDATALFYIGRRSDSARRCRGVQSETAIYDHGLSPTRITAHYYAGRSQ